MSFCRQRGAGGGGKLLFGTRKSQPGCKVPLKRSGTTPASSLLGGSGASRFFCCLAHCPAGRPDEMLPARTWHSTTSSLPSSMASIPSLRRTDKNDLRVALQATARAEHDSATQEVGQPKASRLRTKAPINCYAPIEYGYRNPTGDTAEAWLVALRHQLRSKLGVLVWL